MLESPSVLRLPTRYIALLLNNRPLRGLDWLKQRECLASQCSICLDFLPKALGEVWKNLPKGFWQLSRKQANHPQGYDASDGCNLRGLGTIRENQPTRLMYGRSGIGAMDEG